MFDDLLIHNWWLIGNEKMSKSKKNIIDPMEIEKKYGTDMLRFFCIKRNLINSDEDFHIDSIISDYNTFVVNKSQSVFVVIDLQKPTMFLLKPSKVACVQVWCVLEGGS